MVRDFAFVASKPLDGVVELEGKVPAEPAQRFIGVVAGAILVLILHLLPFGKKHDDGVKHPKAVDVPVVPSSAVIPETPVEP